MKIKSVSLLTFLLASLVVPSVRSEQGAPVSLEAMMKMMQAGAEKSMKSRQDLYRKFLPKPKDLGQGWLLPWELPKPMKQYDSEEDFWQAMSGVGLMEGKYRDSKKSDQAFFGGMVSALVELSPRDLETYLSMFLQAAKELPKDEVPPGFTAEQLVFGTMGLVLKWQVVPSLAKKTEQIFDFLGEMQKIAVEMMAKTEFGTLDSGPRPDERQVMMKIITKPWEGKTGQQMQQDLTDTARAMKGITAMTYTTCDNWSALQSGEEKEMSKIHLRHVVVTLTVLDNQRMEKLVDDLTPEKARKLQQTVNQRLTDFREFTFETLRKKRTAELQKELQEETNRTRRTEIQEELAKVPEAVAKVRELLPKVEVQVYTRDFGDNCYVVSMKGDINLPELTMPATNLQAYLRNGNAVVTVGLGGNYTADQMKKELDLFLSDMDARTAFFRN